MIWRDCFAVRDRVSADHRQIRWSVKNATVAAHALSRASVVRAGSPPISNTTPGPGDVVFMIVRPGGPAIWCPAPAKTRCWTARPCARNRSAATWLYAVDGQLPSSSDDSKSTSALLRSMGMLTCRDIQHRSGRARRRYRAAPADHSVHVRALRRTRCRADTEWVCRAASTNLSPCRGSPAIRRDGSRCPRSRHRYRPRSPPRPPAGHVPRRAAPPRRHAIRQALRNGHRRAAGMPVCRARGRGTPAGCRSDQCGRPEAPKYASASTVKPSPASTVASRSCSPPSEPPRQQDTRCWGNPARSSKKTDKAIRADRTDLNLRRHARNSITTH